MSRKKAKSHTIFDEHILDDVAVSSPLRGVSAGLKLILSLSAIIIAVSSPLPWLPLFIAVVMIFASLAIAKVNLKLYLSLLTIPLVFGLTGAIVLLFVTGGGETIIKYFDLGFYHIQITTDSLQLSILVLSRTFAGMCSLFFFVLTTPVTSLFQILKKLHFPQEFIDLMMLIYRYIFVFIGETVAIHKAQVMRGGYNGWRSWISSFSMLASILFIKTWERGEDIFLSMSARCYDGCMVLPDEESRLSIKSVTLVSLFLGVCVLILVLELIIV